MTIARGRLLAVLGAATLVWPRLFVAVAIFGILMGVPRLSESQTPADDVAAQVRSQGFQCEQPIQATRNVTLSRPDSAVWVLKCRNAVYRVRLDPDMEAHVTKLKTSH